jgi:hypothetical protein
MRAHSPPRPCGALSATVAATTGCSPASRSGRPRCRYTGQRQKHCRHTQGGIPCSPGMSFPWISSQAAADIFRRQHASACQGYHLVIDSALGVSRITVPVCCPLYRVVKGPFCETGGKSRTTLIGTILFLQYPCDANIEQVYISRQPAVGDHRLRWCSLAPVCT